MKKCITCEKDLDESKFEVNRKQCMRCRGYMRYHQDTAKALASRKKWRDANKDKMAKIHARSYAKANAKDGGQRRREYSRKNSLKLKMDVYHAYSGEIIKCALCPENDMACLSLDHINGDGAEHRRQLHTKSGDKVWRDLRKRGYPEGFQILCMNCQFKKRAANKELKKRIDL